MCTGRGTNSSRPVPSMVSACDPEEADHGVLLDTASESPQKLPVWLEVGERVMLLNNNCLRSYFSIRNAIGLAQK